MSYESIVYRLEHSTATVELALDAGHLRIATCGKGLLDKEKLHVVSLADVAAFAVAPTIGAQNLGRGTAGGPSPDTSYDAEFLIVLRVNGHSVKRRMFVNSQNLEFQRLLAVLAERSPAASLLHLEPDDARDEMGFVSPRSAVLVILFFLIGLPILVALLMLAYTLLTE